MFVSLLGKKLTIDSLFFIEFWSLFLLVLETLFNNDYKNNHHYYYQKKFQVASTQKNYKNRIIEIKII